MAIFASNIITSDSALGSAKIQKSLRFNDDDSSYLLRTPSSNGNRQTWTFSAWVKRSNITTGTYPTIFSTNSSSNYSTNGTYLWFYNTDELGLSIGSGTYKLKTTAKFTDPISWYNVVAHVDTTQGTASDRAKLYVNGEEQTDLADADYPTQNYSTRVNDQTQHIVGARRHNSIDNYFDGYIAEVNFIDGQALDASYFGFTDPQTGIWMPKKFTPNKINNGTTWSSNATTSNLAGGNIADVFDGDTYDSATINSSDASNNHFTLSSVNVNASKVTVYVSNSGSDITVYINGASVGTVSSGDMSNNVSKPFSFTFTETIVSTIKVQRGSSTSGWIIYGISLDDVMLIDGNTSNIGVNGFRLDYSDNSSTAALGTDKSNNGNDWTANNLSVTAGEGNDSVLDTPTKNWATLNLLEPTSNVTFSEGNLKAVKSNAGFIASSNFVVTSGKWYMEMKYVSGTSNHMISVGFGSPDRSYQRLVRGGDGELTPNTGNVAVTFADPDVLMLALDVDNGKWYIGKNGSYMLSGDPVNGTGFVHSGLSSSEGFKFIAINNTSTGGQTISANFGQQGFTYTPPTGFKAFNSSNIQPDPTINTILRPQRHFDTILYTGNDGSQTITGLEFDPDFVWAKNRQDAGYHHDLYDTVRGNNLRLFSSQTQAEATGYLQFGVTGGFSLTSGGGINSNNKNHVAWCWKAGGAAVSNTNGNITSSVSVNEEAGFSIVSYTGNGSNGQTVGHGLSQAPKWIILKARDATQNWRVWHHSLATDGSKRLLLDAQNASEDAGFLNDTAPTSTVFTLGNADDAWNANGAKFIAYCWHEVPGYSKFGSYTGNGSTDGPLVFTGFRPAWIMIKISGYTGNWIIFDNKRDPFNYCDTRLFANLANADTGSYNVISMLSNGFKFANQYDGSWNRNNTQFIYVAFAEEPGATPFDTFANSR